MDYRYYRGEGIQFPPGLAKRLYLLRYIGAFMIVALPVLGLLMVFQIIKPSLLLFFAGMLSGSFGNVLFIIGMTYDTVVDRDGESIRVRVRLFGKPRQPGEFRPGRRMIYDEAIDTQAPDAVGIGVEEPINRSS